jgi:hypothetical protein
MIHCCFQEKTHSKINHKEPSIVRTIADLNGSAIGKDVILCAPGVSLSDFDWKRLEGSITVALNGAISAPGFVPTYHFWCDALVTVKWLVDAPNTIVVCPNHGAPFVRSVCREVITYQQVQPVEIDPKKYLSTTLDPRWPSPFGWFKFPDQDIPVDGDTLYALHTCATGALHFAAKLGARRILLLGFDAYGTTDHGSYFDGTSSAVDTYAPIDIGDGRIRSCTHIWWDMEQTKAMEFFERTGRRYPSIWPGPGIYNLSKHSTLTAWQKVDQEVALADALRPKLVGAGR